MSRLNREIARLERLDDLIAGGAKAARASQTAYDEVAATMRRFTEPESVKIHRQSLVDKGLVPESEVDDFYRKIIDTETGGPSSTRAESLRQTGLEQAAPGKRLFPAGYAAVNKALRRKGFSMDEIRREFGGSGNFYGQPSLRAGVPFAEEVAGVPFRVPGMAQHQTERAIQKATAKFEKKFKPEKEPLFPQRKTPYQGKRSETFEQEQRKIIKGLHPEGLFFTRQGGLAKRLARGAGASATHKSTQALVDVFEAMPDPVKTSRDGGLAFHQKTIDPMHHSENGEGVVLETHTYRVREALKEAETKEGLKGTTWKNVPVYVEDVRTKTGAPGAARYDRDTGYIAFNREASVQRFEEKAWTRPRLLSDDSQARPLPVDQFKTQEEWDAFVIEHEWQHSKFSFDDFRKSKTPVETDEFGVPMIGLKDPERFPGEDIVNQGAYEDEINQRALKAIAGTTEREGKQLGLFAKERAVPRQGVLLKKPMLTYGAGVIEYYPAQSPAKVLKKFEKELKGGGAYAGGRRELGIAMQEAGLPGPLSDYLKGVSPAEFRKKGGSASLKRELEFNPSNIEMQKIEDILEVIEPGKKRKITRIGFDADPATTALLDDNVNVTHQIRGYNALRRKTVTVRGKRVPKKGTEPGGVDDFATAVGLMKKKRREELRRLQIISTSQEKEAARFVEEFVENKIVFIEHQSTIAGVDQARRLPIRIGDLSRLNVRNMVANDVDFFPVANELWGVSDEVDTDGIRQFIRPLRETDLAVKEGRASVGAKIDDLSQEELDYVTKFKEMMNNNWQELVQSRFMGLDEVGYNPLTKTHYPRRYEKLRSGIIDNSIPKNPYSSSASEIRKQRTGGFGIPISDEARLAKLGMKVPAPIETLPHYTRALGEGITKRKYQLYMADLFGRPKSHYMKKVMLKPGTPKTGEVDRGIELTKAELDQIAETSRRKKAIEDEIQKKIRLSEAAPEGSPQKAALYQEAYNLRQEKDAMPDFSPDWWEETRTTEQWDEWARDARTADGKEAAGKNWKMMENAQGEEVIIPAEVAKWIDDLIGDPEKLLNISPSFKKSKQGQVFSSVFKFGKMLSSGMKRAVLLPIPGYHKVNQVTDTVQLMAMGMNNPVKWFKMVRRLLKDPAAFKMQLPTGGWVTGTELLANARMNNLGLDSLQRLDTYGTSLSVKEKLAISAARTSGKKFNTRILWAKLQNVGIKQGEHFVGEWVDTTQLAGFLFNVKKETPTLKPQD